MTVHISPDVDTETIIRLLQQGFRVVVVPRGEQKVVAL